MGQCVVVPLGRIFSFNTSTYLCMSLVMESNEGDPHNEKPSSWRKVSKLSSVTTLLHGVHSSSSDENERKRRKERVAEQLGKNYYYDDGVAKWPTVYPIAISGRRQSPIDIVPSKAKADDALRPLEISYAEDCVKNLANTGNSWKADVD